MNTATRNECMELGRPASAPSIQPNESDQNYRLPAAKSSLPDTPDRSRPATLDTALTWEPISQAETSATGATSGLGQRVYVAFGKRAMDILLAVPLIIVFSPVMLAIACWIVLDSPGRAIFSQERVGRGQRPFTIYKFRSMAVHAHVMLENDPALASQYAAHWKLVRDPRVTRCGAFLRRSSLDELPQLINVLKGDMSLVGPRPYLAHELNGEFGQYADVITSVKPGMTGLWQVSGRSLMTPSHRIHLDEQYATKCIARLDMLILVRTIKVVVRSCGAI